MLHDVAAERSAGSGLWGHNVGASTAARFGALGTWIDVIITRVHEKRRGTHQGPSASRPVGESTTSWCGLGGDAGFSVLPRRGIAFMRARKLRGTPGLAPSIIACSTDGARFQ